MEFTKGSYNLHEHSHTEWTDEQLHKEVEVVTELTRPWQCEERLAQLRRRMAMATNEQIFRYADRHEIRDERDDARRELIKRITN